MIAHSPIFILGTSSISVCDFIHSSSPYQNEVATRNCLDVSNSWSIKGDSRRIHTSSYSRRGPVCDINRKLTMMRLLTKLGVQSLHAITKFADQIFGSTMPIFGSTMPIFGNPTGDITYVHYITKENQNK
jgi:hypothetical protein